MSQSLSDATIRHLQMVADLPEAPSARYELLEPLGHGGMGAVYLAHDARLNRRIALKVVGTFARSSEATERLVREAQILARLEHPGIVPVHDVGQLDDGRAFYTMKLVQGKRLDEHVTTATTLAERLQIVERLCDAVAFAHAHGVVHRDLTPANVMIGAFGEVLLMDWGIAGLLAAADVDGAAGAIAGTPGYMAPEQARGEIADARADIYALGAILRLMLFRTPLPTSGRSELLGGRRRRVLSAIVDRATASRVSDRYQTVEDLRADVAGFRANLAVAAYPETILDRVLRLASTYRLPIALVLAYVLMRVVLILRR